MKRKVSLLPSRIWTYGCQPPTEGQELFSAQLLAAHRYYNVLIEIERRRREGYRQARTLTADTAELEAKHKAVQAQIEEQRAAIKAARAAERKRVHLEPERERLKALFVESREAYAAIKAARELIKNDPGLKAAAEVVDAAAREGVRAARKSSGVYWGTYLLVEKAIEAARKSQIDPEFRRWRGAGRVGVQLHHEKFEDVMAGRSTMLRITPRQRGVAATTGAGSKRSQKRIFVDVQIRAGSGEGREPVFITFPAILHRLPPPGATLTWAWVKVTKIGSDCRYELQLVVESKDFHSLPRGVGVAALDLGWRVMPSGNLRVGFLVDDQRREQVLELPAMLLAKLRFCDELRSYQTTHFDVARLAWLRWLEASCGEAQQSEWIEEMRRLLPHWRSPARLAKAVGAWVEHLSARAELDRLWEVWMAERRAAKQDLFDTLDVVADWCSTRTDLFPTLVYMEWWRRKNRHLHDWEEHQRSKTLGWRREIYRRFAAHVARTYETIVLEDMDLRCFARNAKPEEEASLDHFHRIRNLAAPGELRSAFVSAMGKERVALKPAADSTRKCHRCGHVNDWAPEERAKRVLTCSGCGSTWDQDQNAAIVLLARYFEDYGGGEAPGGARESGKSAGSDNAANAATRPRKRAKPSRSQTGSQDAGIT